MRKTKIVCTLGPASSSDKVMREMLENGMNIARFNFSHGTHESHKKMIEQFRRVRDEMGVPAAVLLDTKGPEIRLKNFENGTAVINKGEKFILDTNEKLGDSSRVGVSYVELPKRLVPGNRILINDGRIELVVDKCNDMQIFCTVNIGGELSNHKGVNIPSVSLGMPYLNDVDKSDLLFGIENDVDFVAASFVRSKDDVLLLRRFLNEHGGENIRIISKIENLEGVKNFDEILEYSDGIMVARGDMGVEIEFEYLPGLQKRFIKRCYQAGKMVITATQMLESMITNSSPTRAEISDVANAVFDGTSAIMLSGESATGAYPALAVEVMAKIAEKAEKDAFEQHAYGGIHYDMDASDITNAISHATCTTARDIKASAIIVITKHGFTARRVSKFRPQQPIIAATPETKTYHQLSLSWGVYPVMSDYQKTTDALFRQCIERAKETGIVENGDRVVITAGLPLGVSGNTDVLKVQIVGNEEEEYL